MTVKQLHDELAKRDLDKKGAKVMSTCRYVGSPVHRDCRQLYKRDYSNTCSDTPVVPPPAKDDDTQTAAIAEVATIPDSTANPPKAKQPNSSHDSADIASSNTGKAVELSIPCNGRLRLLTDEPVDTANTSTTPTVSSSSPDPSIEHAEFKADSTAIDADKALDGKRHLSPPLHSSPRAAKKPKLDATDSIPESKVSPTPTIRIDNFIRPFTLNAVKAFVQVDASFVDDGFWMDAIKTHCYVTYATTDAAIDARTVPSLFYLPVSDDLVARRRANVERKKLGLIRPRPGRSSRRYRHRRRGGNRSSAGGAPLVQA
ncbi:hypothetical protein DYB25_001767 [Aphanomyces astaci]|uniref:SAP domain-containing protein n=1 Tax=Aphanomyces astaci TaxID=112090 RepID=A0A397AWU1_APHAT|nr:hypothetical protein DYB25_001767 [Aphanomyces astaci]